MIPGDKMLEIARGLLEKTQRHEARWRPDSVDDFAYVVYLPGSRIRIALESNTEAFNKVVSFTVSDADDVPVGRLEGRNDEAVGQVLHTLFNEASRVATKWDKVLQEVERALSSEGLIGAAGK